MKCSSCARIIYGTKCPACHKAMEPMGRIFTCIKCAKDVEEKDAKCDSCLAKSAK